MLIDTHCHLNFQVFRDEVDKIIKRTLEEDIWMINVGTQYDTSKKAVEIAERYSQGVFAAVGLHPIHLETGLVKIKNDSEEIEVKIKEEEFDFQKYRELAKPRTRNFVSGAGSKKVVAIGEIGLDYYWRPKTKKKLEEFKEKQKEAFLKQLELAKELNLPVIFHCRMAHQDLYEILKLVIQKFKIEGVMHGFVGSSEQLEKYLEMGFYIGFNGIIFKKIEGIDFEKNIKITPLDKILIETDCPYLTPPQVEGRNEPIYVKYIAEKIAQVKNVSFEKITEITLENTRQLFKI